METTTVRVRVFNPEGAPAEGSEVRAILQSVGVGLDGYVDRSEVTASTDSEGVAEMELWPNASGETDAEYRIVARSIDGRRLIDLGVTVPESDTPVWLHDITMLAPPTPKPYDEASIQAIQQSRVLSQEARQQTQTLTSQAKSHARQAESASNSAANNASSIELIAQGVQDHSDAAFSSASTATEKAGDAERSADDSRGAKNAAVQAQHGAEQARDQTLEIYGDAAKQQKAVTDAVNAASEAVQARNAAAGSSDDSRDARNQAVQAANLATQKSEASGRDASSAREDRIATDSAASEVDLMRGEMRTLAAQVGSEAANALNRSADLISHAVSIEGSVERQRKAAESASQNAVSTINTALRQAVAETYINRAMINLQISTNMIVLRA